VCVDRLWLLLSWSLITRQKWRYESIILDGSAQWAGFPFAHQISASRGSLQIDVQSEPRQRISTLNPDGLEVKIFYIEDQLTGPENTGLKERIPVSCQLNMLSHFLVQLDEYFRTSCVNIFRRRIDLFIKKRKINKEKKSIPNLTSLTFYLNVIASKGYIGPIRAKIKFVRRLLLYVLNTNVHQIRSLVL
jgi:hypothetical protein